MTRYAKRKLKYSLNKNFNLLPYVEKDRFVTLNGAQAEWGLRYRIYMLYSAVNWNTIGMRGLVTSSINWIKSSSLFTMFTDTSWSIS